MSRDDEKRIHLSDAHGEEDLVPIIASLLATVSYMCGGAEVNSISIENGSGYGCPRGVVHITASLRDAKFSYGRAEGEE